MARDFRVFFKGHTGSIEAKYTTNKSILTTELADEMWEAFKRSQELLDLDQNKKQVKEEVPKQKVVTPSDAEQFLATGWKYLGNLQNGNVVIEK